MTATLPTSKPGTRKLWPIVRSVGSIVLALAALVLFLAWMGGTFREKVHPGESPVARESAAGRRTATVEKRMVENTAIVVGSVQPRRRNEVSSQVLARILDVKVRPGDRVEPKMELVLLDDREIRTQQAEAQAAVTVAEADYVVRKADFTRAQLEREKGVIGAADFARYEGAMKVADAQVIRAKEAVRRLDVQLTYTKILATSRGVVGDRFADPGDIAAPGKPLLVIYDPAELELHVNVPESLAPDLRERQKLLVQIDAAGLKDVVGTVREVVPQAQQASRSVLVKVEITGVTSMKPLLPGMYGRVRIPVGGAAERTTERLFLPRAAIRQVGQLDLVDVVNSDGTLSRRFVRVGPPAIGAESASTPDRKNAVEEVEILSGLNAGETVALPAH